MRKNTLIDKIFGPTLFREEEYIESTERLDGLLKDYTDLRIGKLYNLSVKDYINLPKADILVLLRHAKEALKKRDAELEDMLDDE
jgi:hypothetical protein